MESKILIIALIAIIVACHGCGMKPDNGGKETINQKKSNVEQKTNKATKEELSSETSANKNEKESFSKEDFLNKTFYRLRDTDSGLVVVDWYQSGLNGIVFSSNTIEDFGFEETHLLIDSIKGFSNYCIIHYKWSIEDDDSYQMKIEPVPGKPGRVIIHEGSQYIDSTMLHTVRLVEQEPYDIKEAIGDFPSEEE